MIFDDLTTGMIFEYLFEGIKPILPFFITYILFKFRGAIVKSVYINVVYMCTLFFGGSNKKAKKNTKKVEKAIEAVSVYDDIFNNK